MSEQKRTFVDSPAVRSAVPLMVGLAGPSGSGKTYSALRLASGIQRVTGGEIYVVDTEARRALHYADKFTFRHVPFGAPFSPLDYLEAIEHCVARGAKVLVVDSMSHEHEGPGGVLEEHALETERLAKSWKCSAEAAQMPAWAAPKAKRRRLINTVLQLGINAVFCFRAKEKIKIIKGQKPVDMGWMPIAGEEFVYEMTVNCLLPPASRGVPDFAPKETGERQMVKLPGYFSDLFRSGAPLDESMGEAMAKWASGGEAPTRQKQPDPFVELFAAIADAGVSDENRAQWISDQLGRPIKTKGELRALSDADHAKLLAIAQDLASASPSADEQPV